MNEDAKNAQREYQRAYREANRERIREKAKEWRKKNPEKSKIYRERYWAKKAAEGYSDIVTRTYI